MNRDYNDCKDYEGYVAPSEQAIAIPRCKIKGYLHHFFPYIDLSFLLKKIDAIEEGEEFTLRIVGDKLQLIDGEGQVVSEVTLSEGQQGPPGITPNVSAAAFVNDGTGTPSVEVVKSGTTENPTFSFNFSNLKGATGATGPASTVPGPAGTPFQVKAQYDTYAEMIAAHPTGQVGDAYQVGQNSGLATVATTGDYNDLINKPTIPTVNNSTITITQGGVTKGSFTLNQASAATIDVDAGGGGDVFSQIQFSRILQITNVYSDPQCTTKVYERENDTPFTFSANIYYYLETEVIQLVGQQMFLDPIQNYWLGYFAKAGAFKYDIATTYGVPLLEDFGDAATLELLPEESSLSIEGSGDFSGITGTKNLFKRLIMPVKPAGINVNEIDDKITIKFYFMITPTTSLTWTPSQYSADFNINCANGQLTIADSEREL